MDIKVEGHFRPWDWCAAFPKPCLSLLFSFAWRLLVSQDITLEWILNPKLGSVASARLINTAFQGSDPHLWEGTRVEPSVAETPTTCPVYEAANNPLAEMSAMVFYRGLEHLIKDFYSACLILNRSLNCRASKCQCSLNIYIPSSKRKTAKKW